MARHRWRKREIHPARLAMLERALRGGDPKLNPQQAAKALARTREGLRLLAQVGSSPGAPEPRQAALYEFSFTNLASWHLVLLRRVFANPHEAPDIRAQAAEALGCHYAGYRYRWQRRYRRLVEALERGLEDPAPEVRFWSIYALTCMEEAQVLPRLRLIAATDTARCPGMWTLRQEALWAIGKFEGQDLDPTTL
ncbi:hypothetical protein CYFUS_004134 [Cystobacter fuscus]|uniref:HEAT repeat domain-containing protein n=1 Tax=Cystobacter fuscus TaxID=43 RepID=A0A250J427_9BACT|nr:HEAT repeat domain-containing protein [Cystobacter fuscus]ATB38699.1 hypothetical protein CYFUS_004134 [Cystobacter fuscus]